MEKLLLTALQELRDGRDTDTMLAIAERLLTELEERFNYHRTRAELGSEHDAYADLVGRVRAVRTLLSLWQKTNNPYDLTKQGEARAYLRAAIDTVKHIGFTHNIVLCKEADNDAQE